MAPRAGLWYGRYEQSTPPLIGDLPKSEPKSVVICSLATVIARPEVVVAPKDVKKIVLSIVEAARSNGAVYAALRPKRCSKYLDFGAFSAVLQPPPAAELVNGELK